MCFFGIFLFSFSIDRKKNHAITETLRSLRLPEHPMSARFFQYGKFRVFTIRDLCRSERDRIFFDGDFFSRFSVKQKFDSLIDVFYGDQFDFPAEFRERG